MVAVEVVDLGEVVVVVERRLALLSAGVEEGAMVQVISQGSVNVVELSDATIFNENLITNKKIQ